MSSLCKKKTSINSFFFRPEIPFLVKLGPKIQNCMFQVEFGIWNLVLYLH